MQDKLRIIQFLGGLDQGGAESVVRDYTIELSKRGHIVAVPLYYSTPDLPNQIAVQNAGARIDVFRGEYSRNVFNRACNRFLTFFDYDEKKIKRVIEEFKPDIIHLHGYVLKDFDRINSELSGIKIFYTCHSSPQEFFSGRWEKQYHVAKRLIYQNNMQLIALHEDMAKELNKMFDVDNTIILNNPISLSKFRDAQKNKVYSREKYGIPKDAFVIGHVGRFDYLKNHTFLVDIFEEVLKIKPNAVLALTAASGGDTMPLIVEKLKNKGLYEKTFIMLDEANMEHVYSSMDVFVFPSIYEGLGIALLEAEASGLKCVVSDSIPKASIASENIIQMKLSDSPKNWADAIVSNDYKRMCKYTNISDYEISSVIDRLCFLYGNNCKL